MVFWELIYNAALLLSLGILYFVVARRWTQRELAGQVIQGLLFGSIALAVMANPVTLLPGLVFDTRTVLLSIAGLFAGPLAAAIAVVMTGILRLWAGGVGVTPGLLTIITSAAIGVIFHYRRKRNPAVTRPARLYGFGLIVHLVMLGCMFSLPLPVAWSVLADISLPVLLIYPLVTLLLSLLLVEGERRIEVESGLEKSEKRFRTLAENVPGVVYRCQVDPPYSADYVSEDIQELTGVSADEFTSGGGRSLNQLIAPEDQRQVASRVREAVELREPFNLMYRIQRANGQIRWVHDRGQAFYSQDGEPLWLDGVLLDVTASKQAEDDLRFSKEMAEHYLQMAGTMLLSLDKQGRIILLNKKGYNILGYEQGRLLGRNWFDTCLPPVWKERVRHSLVSAMKGEGPLVEYYENPVLTRSGQERAIAWHNTLLRNEKGQIYALLSSGEDITDRRLAEKNLRRLSQDMDRFFTLAQDLLCIADTNGVLRRVNQEWSRSLGYSPEELEGRSLVDLAHPQDRHATAGALGQLSESRPMLELVSRCLAKDGGTRWLEWRAVAADEVLFASARDITQRIQDEQERDRLENQLRQTQKLEAIGTLAGGIAHDFNNVLSAIMGYTELAQVELAAGKRPTRELDNVLAAAARARDLVGQILSFSRHSGRKLQSLELRPLLKEALRMIRASIPTTIAIEEDLRARGRCVLADPVQMHQVLMNLCTNAYQAMEDAGGVIRVSLTEVTRAARAGENNPNLLDGDYLLLSVSDNGPGMNRQIRERIFEPFFTTKEPGKGTGMGLSVVHGIVTAHHGAIEVDSRPGQGAAFRVYLPVLSTQPTASLPEPPLAPQRGQGRILLVDDEPSLVEVEHRALESLGYQVTSTTSALEALKLFKERPEAFGLVISDYTMPGMTGAELAEQLLALRRDLPIILCTGYSDHISAEQARRMGIRDLLFKPLNLATLGQVVNQVLPPSS